MSINLKPREISWFKLLNEGYTLFRQLPIFIIGLLIFEYCLAVRWAIAIQCSSTFLKWCLFNKELIVCCLDNDAIYRWCCPLILSKWKWIGISPAIASTSYDGNMKNVPIIHRATLLCIFLSFLRGWYNGTSLKY